MKKIILTAFAALMALAVFTSCEYNAEKKDTDVERKIGIVAGTKVIAFNDCEKITDEYTGSYWKADTPVKDSAEAILVDIDSDGILQLLGKSWDKYYITLKDAIDVSSYKEMVIMAKCADKDWTKPDVFIVELSDGTNASGMDGWTQPGFLDLTSDYKEFTVKLESLKSEGSNSVYADSKALEDFKSIKEIAIQPRGAKGNFYIAAITFK